MRPRDTTRTPALTRMRDWLDGAAGRSQAWLADQLIVSRSTVYRWVQGENAPDAAQRRKIHDLSVGMVHFDDWYTDEELRDAYRFSPRMLQKKLTRRQDIQLTG